MLENKKKLPEVKEENNEQLSLNDDRRVKVLSPGRMVAKRFFRNRVAVVGLSILIFMFVFSFLGGLITPYEESQLFYKEQVFRKEVAGAKLNTDYRYLTADSKEFTAMVQANAILSVSKNNESFNYGGKDYKVTKEGNDFYSVSYQDNPIGAIYKDILWLDDGSTAAFDIYFNTLKIFTNDDSIGSYELNGKTYNINEDNTLFEDGKSIGYVSRYIVQPIAADVVYTREFKEEILNFLEDNDSKFKKDGDFEEITLTKNEGEETETVYTFSYNAGDKRWSIRENTYTTVYDLYAAPSKDHWLGTDGNGMDMLTRLMYGGRVSLIIGFIVVIIETFIGVILGGISGYFGKWVDMLIMRIVDILYCIPSTPLLIIIGAAMDAMGVDPTLRMLYLMLILGFLGWPSVARMVRGQILSLREQEFMTATEATGLSVYRKISRHLIPNVIPQLIVTSTMGIGGTILTEATLSFLGLGVRFPFASWGNIINDVSSTYVLTTYLWVWIPAGCCILLTVLAFNLVGDGLRDAFDPKMKR